QSLSGDARSRAGGKRPLAGSRQLRLLVALGVVVLSVALLLTYRKSRADFETQKTALILEYKRQTRPFDTDFRLRVERVDEFLKAAHEEYQGDHIADSFRRNLARLDEALRGPLVYVRGPLDGFRALAER